MLHFMRCVCSTCGCRAAAAAAPRASPAIPIAQSPGEGHGELADEPLVDVSKVDPTIVIDLRYATARNITGHPIYPAGTPCLLRRGVAERLRSAQALLHVLGYRLKIWDAYRPSRAQQILWELVKNPEVVADPAQGGSRHSWGVAVDVTLVDLAGKDVPMPTDFDDFTAAAKSDYKGTDPIVAKNLGVLKNAMELAGFEGMREEWWHYSAKNWRSYSAIAAATPPPVPEKPPVPPQPPGPAPATSPSPATVRGTNPPAPPLSGRRHAALTFILRIGANGATLPFKCNYNSWLSPSGSQASRASISISRCLSPACPSTSTGSTSARNTRGSPCSGIPPSSPSRAFSISSSFLRTKCRGLIRYGMPSTPSSGPSAARCSPSTPSAT